MTLPQEASADSVSKPAPAITTPPLPQDLICPADRIFDVNGLNERLAAAVDGGEGTGRRVRAIGVLAEALANGRAAIEEAFEASPRSARPLVHSYAWLTDCIIRSAFWTAKFLLVEGGADASDQHMSVIAVGGYGRAEMAPHSDVDLLFLAEDKISPRIECIVEEMLYILWDLRLKVGHATRTIRECLKLGREDYTIRTSLLEMRHVDGDAILTEMLTSRLWNELFKGSSKDYIEAKLSERAERHRKQGGQRYMLEPNIKEGKGGLRDLQSLFWIAKYVHRVNRIEDLVGIGVFTPEEFWSFEQAETFLWAARGHLHLIAGRPAEQLTFDMQVPVAERLGYSDHSGRRSVEHFMQDYFRHATRVGELTRIFLTSLEAAHAKREPMLAGLFRRRKVEREGFVWQGGRLAIADDTAFLADKLNILRLFDEALQTDTLIHPDAMRLVSANLHLIDAEMRRDPEAAKIFLRLMLDHGNPERALRRMNEVGVLAAFVPEFEPIVAMMQFNFYHAYTVDEHTIQCIRVLAQIEHGELVEELPVASRILERGVDRKVLYLAVFLHDIGKGRVEDHSVLGARIARPVCKRLGLTSEEADTVEWLVRAHLVMSDMAQKRDIADPRTVSDFAKIVKTRKRLDLLTVLTVCDIRGVGPNVWNNWKAQLLRTLHRQTADALDGGMEDLNRENIGEEAQTALRAALSDWSEQEIETEIERHYSPYWQGLPEAAYVTFAKQLRGLSDDEIRIDLTPEADRDATRACFALVDHPGVFSRLAGSLALVGANVVDARTYTSKDGYATAIFWIQDGDGAPYEASRLPRLTQMIEKCLKGEIITGEALRKRDKQKKRERDFRFPTSVHFDNNGSEIYTLIEVDTRDRPGLLFDLTRTLANSHIYIASAVIATYGAQAVDTFYVKDMFGLKIHSKSKQKALEKKLVKAIERGAERARSE
ncbi:UTP--GlnB (protein PII) uridylyltransferase GlnD [Aliiruegeria haliotis]|uniref:Bifunctional uridylyltransferase/uridylyl-removing enzyme n=1 Tax=Aliiruegeria haliotis TaxID=1280846 RepID=A0A2T0RWI7_9RHOB|nr:[protein-PII] uridylyltransferase [Aliiruegeria haliotis]PRY25556.1 UTP--GlnB (protein PII) uridylyltransferase GlnD [Aliiruegeria haliotis]